MNQKPTLFNGPTVYGLFGQKRLRHRAEIPLLIVTVLTTVLVLAVYVRNLASSVESCQSAMDVTADLLGFGFFIDVCGSDSSLLKDSFALIWSIFIFLSLAIWVARAVMYARLRAQSVRMSPTQFPEGYKMVVEAAHRFGLRRVPDAYVVLGNGTINAYASGHGYRRFVAVYSDLFEIGGAARDPEALRFIINHEVGHLAAGHTSFIRLLFTMIGVNVPILGTAFSRSQEYTADNYGYDGAPSGVSGAIGLLGAGKYLGAQVNFHAIADRSVTERGLWLHIANWMSTHPVLTWRAQALRDRSRPGRIMLRPRAAEGPQRDYELLPSGGSFTKEWPTPLQVLEMMEHVKPATEEEQFGRYPGRNYSTPADVLRLANPYPAPSVPPGYEPTTAPTSTFGPAVSPASETPAETGENLNQINPEDTSN